MSNKRFQECNMIEKLWRYRFYLYVLFHYLIHFIKNKGHVQPYMYDLFIGEANFLMNWWYTSSEIRDNIKSKFRSKHKEIRKKKLNRILWQK